MTQLTNPLKDSHRSMSPRFIGQKELLARFHTLLEQQSFFIVSGPAGSGKTRLACEGAHGISRDIILVGCKDDDSAKSVLARAARRLGVLPERLFGKGRGGEQVIVIDQLEKLASGCQEQLLVYLGMLGNGYKVVLLTREQAGELPYGCPVLRMKKLAVEDLPEGQGKEPLWPGEFQYQTGKKFSGKKALELAALLAASPSPLSSAELKEVLGWESSTVEKTLTTLQNARWVDELPDSRYFIGEWLLEFWKVTPAERKVAQDRLDTFWKEQGTFESARYRGCAGGHRQAPLEALHSKRVFSHEEQVELAMTCGAYTHQSLEKNEWAIFARTGKVNGERTQDWRDYLQGRDSREANDTQVRIWEYRQWGQFTESLFLLAKLQKEDASLGKLERGIGLVLAGRVRDGVSLLGQVNLQSHPALGRRAAVWMEFASAVEGKGIDLQFLQAVGEFQEENGELISALETANVFVWGALLTGKVAWAGRGLARYEHLAEIMGSQRDLKVASLWGAYVDVYQGRIESALCRLESLKNLPDVFQNVANELQQRLHKSPQGWISPFGGSHTAQNHVDAMRAERSGNQAVLFACLLSLAYERCVENDWVGALSAATRVARQAGKEYPWHQCRALIILAACERHNGRESRMQGYLQEAMRLAKEEELPLECAITQLASMPGENGRMWEATFSESDRGRVEATLRGLSFSRKNRFQTVDSEGNKRSVVDVPAGDRSLMINQSTQVITAYGKVIADLKRRTLLKKLAFEFGKTPGVLLKKWELIERVWGVEYHPLRHDATLFTNIMRLRRLLNDKEGAILQSGEEGYLFCPPTDFLFIEKLATQAA